MSRHPGGEAHTRHLLELAGFAPGAKILDMGAGDGSAVRLMRKMGLEARGIDLCPEASHVERGDFLRTGLPAESFDGILSQCAFYISGDAGAAFRESARLLKAGGLLLFSDVWFTGEKELRQLLNLNGLRILTLEDDSAAWKEYYIGAIWSGEIKTMPVGAGRCRYYSLTAVKDPETKDFASEAYLSV